MPGPITIHVTERTGIDQIDLPDGDVRVGHFHEGVMLSVGKVEPIGFPPEFRDDGTAVILSPDQAQTVAALLLSHAYSWEQD